MNSVVLRQINPVSHIGEPWYVILDFDVWDKPLLLNPILYMSQPNRRVEGWTKGG